jgi:hypothetical protein
MADIKISQLAFVSDPSPSGLVEVSVPTPSGYVSRSTFKHSPFDFPVVTDTVSKTAQFTAELGKRHLIDTSGGGFTADLPTVASPGLISFLIETTSNNQLTISPSGADKVGGKNQFKIRSGATTIESDGIEWHIIQRTGRNPNRIDPPDITTDLDPFDNADWDSAATEVYLSASGVRTIQGFEESTFIDMDNVLVVNDGSSNIIIAHDNATTVSNSVLIQGGANYTLPPNGAIRITRDGTVNKWRLASTSSVGGGGGGLTNWSENGLDLVPNASGTQSIGSSSFPVKDIYVEPSSLYLGDTAIQNDNGNLKFGAFRVRTESDSGVYREVLQSYEANTFILASRQTFANTGTFVPMDGNSGNDSKVTITVPSPDSIIEMEMSVGSINLGTSAIAQMGFNVNGTDEQTTFSQNATPWGPASYKKTVTGYSGTIDIYPVCYSHNSDNFYVENNYANTLTVKVYDPNPLEAAPTVQGPYEFVASKDVTSLQSSIDLSNIFSNKYIGYKIIAYDIQGGAENVLGLRFETGGSFDSGTNYKSHRSSTNDTTNSYSAGSGTTSYIQCGLAATAATSKGVFEMIITNPTSTSLYTEAVGSTVNTNYSGNMHGGSFIGVHLNAAAVTGIQLIVPSTTILGKVVVWGIKKNFEEKEFLPIGMDFQESTPLVASFTTQSTSLVDSGLTTTITPSSASSKILLNPVGTFTDGSSAADNRVYFQYYRDGSPIGSEFAIGSDIGGGGEILFSHSAMTMIDSPNTTSPVTYSVYIRTTNAADYAQVVANSQLQAIEIPGQVVTGVTKLRGDVEYAYCTLDSSVPTANASVSTSTSNLILPDSASEQSSGISVDYTNRRIQVKAGKTYELEGAIYVWGASTATIDYQWHNGTSILGNRGTGIVSTYTSDYAGQHIAKSIYKPTADGYVYFQLFGVGAGAAIIPGSSFVSVKQIDGHIGQSLREEYRMSGVGGYGSTNTAIYYFSTEDKNTLSQLGSVSNDSTNGFAVTALEDCEISITASTMASGNLYLPLGISLNSTQLTTAIGGITAADRIVYSHSPGTNGASVSVSATFLLDSGDVVRVHGDGQSASSTGGVKILLRK